MRSDSVKKTPQLEIQIFAPMTNAQNLHHVLPRNEWVMLSRKVTENAKGLCDVCRSAPITRKLACHERWSVDSKRRVQKLIALQAVCAACHFAIHYGRASGVSYKNAFDHICRVNNWTKSTTRKYIREIEKKQSKLSSNYVFTVDMSYAERYGVKLLPRYRRDVKDVIPFARNNLAKLVNSILRLSKSRNIAVFHNDGCFTCCRIDIDTRSNSERVRLFEALPKMNTSRNHLVGIYSRNARPSLVQRDLLAEFSRCEKLTGAE
jgi:hypothetical protein